MLHIGIHLAQNLIGIMNNNSTSLGPHLVQVQGRRERQADNNSDCLIDHCGDIAPLFYSPVPFEAFTLHI